LHVAVIVMDTPMDAAEPRILHLEDSPADARLIAYVLHQHWPDLPITRVASKQEFDRVVASAGADIVLCDHNIPGVDVSHLLQEAGQLYPTLPVVIVSGALGEEAAVDLIHAGAADYVSKDRLQRLPDAIYKAHRLRRARMAAAAAKAASEVAEARTSLFASAAAEIGWLAGPDGTPLGSNSAFTAFTGCPTAGEGFAPWLEVIHPEDRATAVTAWTEAIATGSTFEVAFRLRRHDGAWRHFISRGCPRRDKEDRIVEWVGAGIDVTELNLARATAREQEAKYQALFEHATDGIVLVSGGGEVLEANREARRCFGEERIIGRSVLDFVAPAERETLTERLRTLGSATGEIRSYTLVRTDGTSVPVETHSQRLPDGRILSVLRDVSASQRIEERLSQQALILEQATDAISVRDFDEAITTWNKGAERLYGWSAAEAIGQRYSERVGLRPEEYAHLRAQLEESDFVAAEIQATHRSGRELRIAHRCTVIRDHHGARRSILAIDTDVTATREGEAAALRAERVESLGTLAAGIAHDLNNILTPISMGVGLLRTFELPPGLPDIVAAIERSGQRAAKLVGQILLFSRGVQGERTLLRIDTVLRSIAEFIEQTFPKNILVQREVPGGLPLVMADPTQVEQVILNLCVNARDAMPQGGKLTLAASRVTVDRQYAAMLGSVPAGEYLFLQVSDTGSGIAPEIMSKIFDPFFTTKPPGSGTGLGLPTCQTIVRSHGGAIRVETKVGQGTRFSVYLPTAGQDGKPVAAEDAVPVCSGHGETILVVDDEATVLAVLKPVLEQHQYRVLTAANGAEAVAQLAAHLAAVDLVIADLMMPIMDGFATAVALRQLKPGLPLIGMSGVNTESQEHRAKQAGFRHFLPKPFSAPTVLKLVQTTLGRPG
jgi:PAS domain S-box-containing protein